MHRSSLFALALALALPLGAQELWVDSTLGDDANPGTAVAPVRSIGRALALAGDGARVTVRRGPYGASDSGERFPLVLRARIVLAASERVVVDLESHAGAGFAVEPSATGARITGFLFRGGAPGSRALVSADVIGQEGARDVEVDRCLFLGVDHGIVLGPATHGWQVHNCVFDQVRGVAVTDADATSDHCLFNLTIVRGSGTALATEGVATRVRNCVVAGNAVGVSTGQRPFLAQRFAANDVHGNGSDWAGLRPPPGNHRVEPGFVDPAGGDFRLLPSSPLVDLGDAAVAARADPDGNSGNVDSALRQVVRPDLGAHERSPVRLDAVAGCGRLAVALTGSAALPAVLLASFDEGRLVLPNGTPMLLDAAQLLPPLWAGTLPLRAVLHAPAPPPGVRLVLQGIALDPTAAASAPSRAVTLFADPLRDDAIEERFRDDDQLDRTSGSGTWRAGQALPAAIGGDGAHGEFEPADGRAIGGGAFEWSTDQQLIPAHRTLSGRDELVTDGVFRFSRLVVPAGVTILFTGRHPVRLHVRGEMDVQGSLVLNAPGMPEHAGGLRGQPGGDGGPGGGRGGDGANAASGGEPGHDGGRGEAARVLAGHFYASRAAGTGGAGSRQFPLSGRNADVTFGYSNLYSTQLAAGGGGGGNALGAAPGRAAWTWLDRRQDLGPDAPGGGAFDPWPLPASVASFEHFLIGGAGGGGAGSHPFFSIAPSSVLWRSGAGGGGGGGALGARVGGELRTGPASSIETRGGGCAMAMNSIEWPAPGGGGAGGAIVLQVAGTTRLEGVLDTRGGSGGINSVPVYQVYVHGGSGAHGPIRLETREPPDLARLSRARPAASAESVAPLAATTRDRITGTQSKWYASLHQAQWLRYELDALVNGVPVRFSDDPAVGLRAEPGQPVQLYVQGADVDPLTRTARDPRPWRAQLDRHRDGEPALIDDDASGLRFVLLFDRATADVVVRRVAFLVR